MFLGLAEIITISFLFFVIFMPSYKKTTILLGSILIIFWLTQYKLSIHIIRSEIITLLIGFLSGILWTNLIVLKKTGLKNTLKFVRRNPKITINLLFTGLWEELMWRGAILDILTLSFVVMAREVNSISVILTTILPIIITTSIFYFAHKFSSPSKGQAREFLLFFYSMALLVSLGMPIFLVIGMHSGRNIAIETIRFQYH